MVCKTAPTGKIVMEPNRVKTKIKLCVEEQQGIFRRAYKLALENSTEIEILKINEDIGGDCFALEVTLLKPDVLLMGFSAFDKTTAGRIRAVMETNPSMPIVLLCGRYDTRGVKMLKDLCSSATAGFAFILKHSINTSHDLVDLICSVANGRCILDSAITEALFNVGESKFDIFYRLTLEDMGILHWISLGYGNNTIARVFNLCLPNLEKRLKSIYHKLDIAESKDARVEAVRQYFQVCG